MNALSKALAAMLLLAMLVIGVPLLVYAVTLSLIDGRPVPVAAVDTAAITCRNQLVLRMDPLDPVKIWRADDRRSGQAPGHEEAFWLARRHLSGLPRTGMLRWHLNNAVLHVWIVRHWTPQQITDTARRDGACRPVRASR